MKNKGLAVLAAAVMLTVGLGTMTTWAAGWEKYDGNWVYYNSDGSMVTYDWKKGADDQWRYLNGSGNMAVNEWIDGTYYVDGNGIMVVDRWQELGSSYDGQTEDTHWYYFSSTGKAVMDAWKKIGDGWYHFDDSGSMSTGWTDDNMYFCDEVNGAAKIGWNKLQVPEEELDESDIFDEDDGKRWYYFSGSGKKYIPSDGAEYGERRIDNAYYCFDDTGIMQTGWVNIGEESSENAPMGEYRFYGTDGKVKTGWYSAEPPEDKSGQYEDEVEWFYFSKSGVPKASKDDEHLNAPDIMYINKKRYLFKNNGTPAYGLQKVYTNENSDEYTAYYFGSKSDCAAHTGNTKVEESDGTMAEYYFTETGKGFTGVKSNSLYYKGKLQKAEEGVRYQVITLPTSNSHTNYLVSTSGRIVKATGSSGIKDGDGIRYITNSSGVVLKIDGEAIDSNATFREVEEPNWG